MDQGHCRDALSKLLHHPARKRGHPRARGGGAVPVGLARRPVAAARGVAGVPRCVPHPQFLDCLSRLLWQTVEARSMGDDGGGWSRSLAGNSLGVSFMGPPLV